MTRDQPAGDGTVSSRADLRKGTARETASSPIEQAMVPAMAPLIRVPSLRVSSVWVNWQQIVAANADRLEATTAID